MRFTTKSLISKFRSLIMLANNCLHCLSCPETILGLIVYLPEMRKIARTSLLSPSSSLLLPTYVEHKKYRPTGLLKF